ncbi:MAG: hypothetical protein HND52_04210 [Ignavibacteriae bacterium]|nr:hypothetical protein [Ignavibacteriota bacterium]NOG97161.1 hypothetical protein [Ignavibacteriota bacterium]
MKFMRSPIAVMFYLLGLTLNAQIAPDSVNIKMIVQNQIKAAQEVLEKEKEKIEIYKAEQQAKVNSAKKNTAGITQEVKAEDDIYLKLYIVLTAVFLATLVVAYRRRKAIEKTLRERQLKKNIKLMREETPYTNAEDELKDLRKIMLNAAEMSDSANELTMGKDNFRLSKGEILLAEKIIAKRKKTKTKIKSSDKNDKAEAQTGRKQKAKIEKSIGLSEEEILKKAKELKISREEVMLAELLKKIKSSAA